MTNPLQNAIEEFKKLPTSGKIAVLGAIASIIALVIMTRSSGTSTTTTGSTGTGSSNPLSGLGGNSTSGNVATTATPAQAASPAPITYPWEYPGTSTQQQSSGTLGAIVGLQAATVVNQGKSGTVGSQVGTQAGQIAAQTLSKQTTVTASQIGATAAKALTQSTPPVPILSTSKAVKATSAPTYSPAPVNTIVAPVGTRRAIAV